MTKFESDNTEMNQCNCIGPQDGEPYCPCMMKNLPELNREIAKGLLAKKSGFEDDPIGKPCPHPSHNPPTHMVIPHGKLYRHICPECGYECVIRSNQPWCNAADC